MSKAHKSWPHRRRNQFSSQRSLKKEMNFFQQQPPPFGTVPPQMTFPPNWQGVEKDPAFLTKDFNLLTLNNQPLPGNTSQPRAKGPENNLHNQYEQKVRPYIDLIDSLRALGVEQDLALPAIAVIGDQSSGKSSVLEALSGVALPRGSGIVTRCPLVLKLKKQPYKAWAGRISYQNTEIELQDPGQVEKEIHKAQNVMAGNGLGISHELISLEITSPEVPDLTIIDLPGIARVAVGNQPRDIGLQIKALIKRYIQRQQTINLVVVPCNVDIATTEALSMAHEVDPEGDRTIGILTKPDLMDRGTEKSIINVVRNLTYPLKKGYMIVKCRGQQEIINRLSLAEATKKEITFFQTHPCFRVLLEEGSATVPRLAERLTAELITHIQKSLPLLEEQIRESHQKATEELRRCGADIPSQDADKMFFLIEKIKMFNQDIEKLIEGEEVVRENETRLYNKIREDFKNWIGILATNTQKVKNIIHEEVEKYEKQYRGKELLGFVNYKTFETIVHQYIQHLVEPALSMLQKAVEIIRQAFVNMAKKHFGEFFNLNHTVQSKIEDIKVRHTEKAENMIQLQFRMEQIVFCQDQIYSVVVKKVREEIFNPLGKPSQNMKLNSHFPINESSVSSFNEIGVHLNAYFSETSTRLANQIPFIIQYFMLRENGDSLQKAMMQILQEKNRYSWLLQEQSETATKRRMLKERIYRLTQARHALCQFSSKEIH
ncbi:interferon-induced GTP-binding protein Mx2 [Macaca thibetana thibetana]|uniref:Interferon-induced GTP-binding protein Mx2 n=7 Tax=Macaca TaxID=9539 RepID=MX2_MACMU|nr:interferon-induced GTP-binding protein Mx2 [Macaca mulatta]XP_005548704.1 interferon-induced GTP-binding protein Mx2 [Macaca fascicularis]XP_011724302.1 interferon-induced GTP-binding protein Mx2 [Macaca nemestrina]XP_011724303.1 interferon-induced GTP-binding protein Mx2 [Macaca nemestrina]XP_011724304.1 interferon-induced GTP-binding protein Mx2 [Macaca nemestrina]XP_011724305.1 interferon-induced GTP-binding protein Mx2 [Macaca nemestrina]XP_014988327.1 interferon-induced GTP-binding pr